MDNFFQSNVWKIINRDIYKKMIFDFEFLWKKYFWVIKEQSRRWLKIRWYQVLGIDATEYLRNYPEVFKKEIEKVKRDYKHNYGDMFFQFGFIDNLATFKIKELRDQQFVEDIKNRRKLREENLKKEYGLIKSFRENMPMATIVVDITWWEDVIWNNMAKSARNHIKKAISNWLVFEFAKDEDWEKFYDVWHETSYEKGFNIVDREILINLRNYLIRSKKWNLFLAKKWDEIISGSICLFVWKTIIYLYWWTNRNYGNIWAHHFLKNEMFKRWFHNWYESADLLWAAPTWDDNHHLSWVTSFKHSLGGKKIEYLWNYDLVFNNNFYQAFKLIRGH